jgi:hypothetical protein
VQYLNTSFVAGALFHSGLVEEAAEALERSAELAEDHPAWADAKGRMRANPPI